MQAKKTILNFAADNKLLKRINDFRFENRIDSRSEAIRLLMEEGLKNLETTNQNNKKNS
jgi:metal-responsive CopG/Arc/MetJ family transcriptional regulator